MRVERLFLAAIFIFAFSSLGCDSNDPDRFDNLIGDWIEINDGDINFDYFLRISEERIITASIGADGSNVECSGFTIDEYDNDTGRTIVTDSDGDQDIFNFVIEGDDTLVSEDSNSLFRFERTNSFPSCTIID